MQQPTPMRMSEAPVVEVDPLVKMQQEKALKKQEEAKRKEYQQKRDALNEQYDHKKEELTK